AEEDGLTNKELAERIIGISDSSRLGYKRLSALVSKLEKRGYLKKVGEKENSLARNSPVRDVAKRGESFLQFAKKRGEISASKSRS
ncbi:hypothetical protein AKJ56_02030, partial [candidate division MSBL1 archaeon SCGC-AAA382N08]